MRALVGYRSVWVAIVFAAIFFGLYIGQLFLGTEPLNYASMQLLERYAGGSLVGRGLMQLQLALPNLNAALYVVTMAIGGLLVNKFTIQNNLYGEPTKLPYIIYTAVGATTLNAPIIVMPAIAALLVTLSITSLYRVSNGRRNSSALLYAAMSLGALPLLYPSVALLLPLWGFVLLITNTHSYRDIGVVLFGVVAPIALGVYLKWQFNSGVSFGEEYMQLFRSMVAPRVYPITWICPTALLIVVCGWLSIRGLGSIGDMSMRYSMRRLVRTSNIWLLLSLLLIATPAFAFEQIAIVATPLALLATIPMIYTRRRGYSYLMLAAICVPFIIELWLAVAGR